MLPPYENQLLEVGLDELRRAIERNAYVNRRRNVVGCYRAGMGEEIGDQAADSSVYLRGSFAIHGEGGMHLQ